MKIGRIFFNISFVLSEKKAVGRYQLAKATGNRETKTPQTKIKSRFGCSTAATRNENQQPESRGCMPTATCSRFGD
jgi:hypothetical protein